MILPTPLGAGFTQHSLTFIFGFHPSLGIGVGVGGTPLLPYFSSIKSRIPFKSVPFSYSLLASRAIFTQIPQPSPILSRLATLSSTDSTKQ